VKELDHRFDYDLTLISLFFSEPADQLLSPPCSGRGNWEPNRDSWFGGVSTEKVYEV
jgi:hypothetical protein